MDRAANTERQNEAMGVRSCGKNKSKRMLIHHHWVAMAVQSAAAPEPAAPLPEPPGSPGRDGALGADGLLQGREQDESKSRLVRMTFKAG